jgi:hypothetical protein
MPFLSAFSPSELYRQLRAQGSASTFDRLLTSRHVADLRVIFLNARDLQVLDALVVTNVTQFYTYQKAMRDSWRQLPKATTLAKRESVMTGIIYMYFLALESARFAIAELIEFEPNEADATLTILLSELPAFAFLLERFKPLNDLRYRRLDLRAAAYKVSVPDLYCRVMQGQEKTWGKLQATAQDVARCYQKAFGESVEAAMSCKERLQTMRARPTKGRRSLGSHAGGVTPVG